MSTESKKVWVVGHKNPDTDSICAAISYAYLKNQSGDKKTYVAKRAGAVNEETRYVLERFGVEFRFARRLNWRQGILLLEIAILLIVGFLPQTLNMTATILVSFSCAMQVQAFRKVDGYSYASTMCIGNLRSGTASLSMYFRERRPEFLKQALYYFGIILFFALGAGAGGNLSVRYGVHVIWVSGGLLMVSVLLMFLEKLRAWNR